MEINRNGNVLDIYGNIKSSEDFEFIKSEIESIINSYDSVVINLNNSISITSALIDFLYKIAENGKRVVVNLKDEMLYNLFEDLNLLSLLNVKKL